MDKEKIINKFGNNYCADDYSFIMGIDIRFADHLAKRFMNQIVMETCSGAGFTTIALAKYAKHVYSIEIDEFRLELARKNSQIAGLENKITFINGDITETKILELIPKIDSAFIDPDWAVTGENHVFRFLNSNTQPPSDKLLESINKMTSNITLIQPPGIDRKEFEKLLPHECEYLYLNNQHELYCLHFGELKKIIGESKFEIKDR
jgi:predicted RNA methylase